jgi:chromosome segregation ATPase
MPLEPKNLFEYAALGLGSVVIIIMGIQNMYNKWKSANAEGSLITLMHEELERLSTQNTKLSQELNRLQLEIISLNSELRKLSSENQNLHLEVASLTLEISRLQRMLEQHPQGGTHDHTR